MTPTSTSGRPPVLRTAEELGARTPLSSATIRRRIRDGALPATKPPGSSCWLIDEIDFSRWLAGAPVTEIRREPNAPLVPAYLTAARAADVLGVDRDVVEGALEEGLLRGYRPEGIGHWVVLFADLDVWATGVDRSPSDETNDGDRLLTTAELAARTPFSKWKICSLIRDGAFPAVKPAGSRAWLVRARDFERWLSGERAATDRHAAAPGAVRALPLPRYLSVGDVADLVGASVETITGLLAERVIEAHRPAGTLQWVVTAEAMHAWVISDAQRQSD